VADVLVAVRCEEADEPVVENGKARSSRGHRAWRTVAFGKSRTRMDCYHPLPLRRYHRDRPFPAVGRL
jgi:hypothetical protein